MTFAELGLSPKVQAAVEAAGYTQPTPIQAAAIPVAVTGRDILGIAQTGTGKTAGFTLPMISRLETGRARARMPRSLILAPTRELAAQVEQSFEKYGVNHKLNVALLIGGVSMDEQIKKLDRGVDVLIATPGRLLDHFGRGRIMLMGVEILVIDEADRMLDMGFIPDIEKICKLLPPRRQTLFFSATMPPEIVRLVDQFMSDPVRVEVARPATTAKTITQRFCYCENGEEWAKRERLRDLMRAADVKNAIVFCNRKRDVAILLKSLLKHGFNAGALHGDMDQKSRMETLDKFRSGEITFLAASDVAARGLDIPAVSHVFNFDLPWQSDDYVHRIGRTGRAGREGQAFSLVTFEDLKVLKDIEKITGDAIAWVGEAPSEADVADSLSRKRRRGRGGPAGRAPARGGAQARSSGERFSERPRRSEPRPAEQAADGQRAEGGAPDRRERAGRRERAAAIPGSEPQPVVEAEARASATRPAETARSGPRDGEPRRRGDQRRQGGGDQARREASSAQPEAAPAREQRQGRGDRNNPAGDRRRDRDAAPLDRAAGSAASGGFADNIPAFLRRPVRRPRPESEQDASAPEHEIAGD
ncbi:MAG: DEAD/DEAH box helicase [Hyphomicrobiaceae bacterium]|nr:DEAD/DEAH box helicase [Hyphomicrobiaceae bacterium]